MDVAVVPGPGPRREPGYVRGIYRCGAKKKKKN